MKNNIERMPVVRGHFKIEMLDKNRNVIDTWEEHNLVMNGSRSILAQAIARGTSLPINKLMLGTAGHINGNLMLPKTSDQGFVPTLTSLFSQTENKFTYTINFVPNKTSNGLASVTETDLNAGSTAEIVLGNNTITYQFELATNAGNGSTGTVGYTEAGLFVGNVLFAMRTFAVRSKDTSSIMRITWTLIF